ncbi:flagellar protein FlgN [Halobacillus litoralis]|uniref:flagellar protein FlgN n=1 Tax=Halobacillus litoralis TaxID=45668 RepID=UPI001CD6AB0E|nr:flagellar protein FlgN [Halobacillus litoralis]MCA0971566.1 flagellar protein FlgN [Halobacillus litoralis]
MSVQPILQTMTQLKQLHESLLALSQNKTDALKANDTTALQKLLATERKHVQAINKVEKQRMTTVAQWYTSQGLTATEPTISEMLEHLEGEQYEALENKYNELILVLADLKKQEILNAELTKQSLQFVNLYLDMLQPSLESVNYGVNESQSTKSKRSVFDSKA